MKAFLFYRPARSAAVLSILWTILVPLTGAVGAPWHVENAPIRFTLNLSEAPTHGSAGYFITLPDGGILPTPFPLTHVVTAKGGKPLASYVLWHNRSSGLGLVFEDPGTKTGDVFVYVSTSNALNLWRPESGLTPSAILCADPTTGSMRAAEALRGLGKTGPTVHYRIHEGHKHAPFSIGGDPSGRSRPCSFYLLAHVETTDPGRTWIAPFFMEGQGEVRVDGKRIASRKRVDKWGGTGQWVDLSKGLHQFEVLQACEGTGSFPEREGLMYLTWRTPKAPAKGYGRVRSKKDQMSEKNLMETRIIRDNEIARSGQCAFREIRSRDGTPVPDIRIRPRDVYWFNDETPIIAYELSAGTAGHPKNTTYTWNFGGGATLSGPEALWLFAGGREQQVALTTSANGKQIQGIKPFFSFAVAKSDLDDAQTRAFYRKTLLNVLEAYPANTDPTADWTSGHWNNFFRTLELGKSQALLTHIFRVRWDIMRRKLPPQQRGLLLDLYLDEMVRTSPDTVLKWTVAMEKESTDQGEKRMMQIRRAEIYLYYLGNPDAARNVLIPILRQRGKDTLSELARIRYGDIEFLSGDLDKATRYYSDVQNRAGHNIRKQLSPSLQPKILREPSRPKAEVQAKRTARGSKEPEPPPDKEPSFTLDPNIRIADWKLNALVDAAASEKVKSLIEQGYLLEAKKALQRWERGFPLSKISSDYVLNEARFYMALKDWKRAEAILQPYCEMVDASSYIPPAVEALLECKLKLKEPKQPLIEFCEQMKKKLEFHPAVEQIDNILFDLKRSRN